MNLQIPTPRRDECAATAPANPTDADHGAIEHPRTPTSRTAIAGAALATIAVVASMLVFLLRPTGGPTTADAAMSTVPTDRPVPAQVDAVDAVDPTTASAPVELGSELDPVPTVPDVGAVPVPSVPHSPSPQVPPVVPSAPPSGQSSPPPPPPPPVPAPVLDVQPSYQLDPGVHGVTISLSNTGDATLAFELADVGDGYTTDVASGDVDPGASVDLWLDLDVSGDVAPESGGPTPFERVVHVSSNGGDATITIAGQVEKPGFLVPDHASLPLVDYRATVSFTNVGGLPVVITELEAPGFTTGPIPDSVAPGETLEVEIAICADDAELLPVLVSVPIPGAPFPGFHYGGDITVGTVEGSATTELSTTSLLFDPPSCQPVVVGPSTDLTLGG